MRQMEGYVMVEMSEILEPAHQLRQQITEEGLEELKASMGKRGLIEPIKLRPKGDKFEIIAGHRRFLAAKDLGWTEIKAIIEEKSDEETILDAIHENIHREDMSPLEEGRGARLVMEKEGKTLKEVARMFSKSESWVQGRLDILEMPIELREAVDVGALSIGACRELARITDDAQRAYYIEYAIKQGATAQLCAFWRGRWEVERTVNDPSAMASGASLLTPPPMEVTLPCFWCDCAVPIHLLDHLRVCPRCRETVINAKFLIQQEEAESAKGGNGKDAFKKGS